MPDNTRSRKDPKRMQGNGGSGSGRKGKIGVEDARRCSASLGHRVVCPPAPPAHQRVHGGGSTRRSESTWVPTGPRCPPHSRCPRAPTVEPLPFQQKREMTRLRSCVFLQGLSSSKRVPRTTSTSSRPSSAWWTSSATRCQRVWRPTRPPPPPPSRTRGSRKARRHRSPAAAVNARAGGSAGGSARSRWIGRRLAARGPFAGILDARLGRVRRSWGTPGADRWRTS